MIGCQIRDANIEDLDGIAALLRHSFDRSLWRYMIYAQRGIHEYLAVDMRYPSTASDRRLIVATSDRLPNTLAGFADYRTGQDGQIFLSYICVEADSQGRGVASALLARVCDPSHGLRQMQLDVFDDNVRACNLYYKMGFVASGASVWVDRRLPKSRGRASLMAPHTALAAHARYGFCEVLVGEGESTERLGLIGAQTIRCFSSSTFQNDELLAGMHTLFPDTDRAFFVLPEEAEPELRVQHQVIKRSIRMTLAVRS
ncbi:GNAT family N-acetyltransferase [Rathayibacter soli]|uniref:GNAT family N-acetyltransferase n=1 Tax=Rathayibacter soli TaxID=3144168 RepID=UPI0027E3FB90|nr:GNAT family N-acetyltransferase [Glaciibacter superstes]